jgi:hypothetical protein
MKCNERQRCNESPARSPGRPADGVAPRECVARPTHNGSARADPQHGGRGWIDFATLSGWGGEQGDIGNYRLVPKRSANQAVIVSR